jgi:hypothetical protein
VLSKYVLALVQNNPEEDGLEATCVAKLDEFLGDGARALSLSLGACMVKEADERSPRQRRAGS